MDANVRSMIREVVEEYLAENLPGLLDIAEQRKSARLEAQAQEAQAQKPICDPWVDGGSRS